ncbi:Acetyltransferase (GNAT) family protein [Streptomyces sp. 2224.1]|uniref:GNAT family N-acetyltransferase n=1 Tax=unclassified Streptomyces TaxID=2593676 RepID=UPI000886FD03|nr:MULTISPECIES: GNAT family N-acetyltransferase [unclassified Streptomyces]PBC80605.1 acetyltransferase (GNAT) family protein [Streptomyces sp. 2321.6]SDR57936.1 Acetyltransferase (GNAT) family protein [Streptomyces sp. KS_16]SEB81346.1 Acetyltransferase (GNAT) family protein [Streptomyces sp. 2133.1]SED43755.1 Acetyltransferase (GNAT) family protein [Streptomyces sp. 2224.1]SEF13789.1 Acetyltransferase (GNAT) family protein [Streptomyces sp. 2112.3]
MKITVRSAAEADLAALLTLYSELNVDDVPMPGATAESIWSAISGQQGRTILVADADGTLAGTADCLLMPNLTRGGRAILFVENVVVANSFQRRGIGRQLMTAAVQLAESAGCYKVQLLAADDAYVHTFYEACGFKAQAQGFRRYLS